MQHAADVLEISSAAVLSVKAHADCIVVVTVYGQKFRLGPAGPELLVGPGASRDAELVVAPELERPDELPDELPLIEEDETTARPEPEFEWDER